MRLLETTIQNKNRLTSDADSTDSKKNQSMQSLVWHITLHNKISYKDSQFLKSLSPMNCSIFVLKDDNIIFQSVSLRKSMALIQTEINFSYEATYAQHVCCQENGLLRILTIPLDDNLLIGLVSQAGLESMPDTEDAFLHDIHFMQKKYDEIKNIENEMKILTKHSDPLLVINRFDDQIIAWNDLTLSFFNLSQKDLLETQLQVLQKNCPKASKRIMHIKNCTIGEADFSVVTYSYKLSESLKTDIITEELKSYTEYLLQHYKDLQLQKDTSLEFIESKIEEINRCYQNITHLHNKEKMNNIIKF